MRSMLRNAIEISAIDTPHADAECARTKLALLTDLFARSILPVNRWWWTAKHGRKHKRDNNAFQGLSHGVFLDEEIIQEGTARRDAIVL